MLFDIRGRRKRFIQVIYVFLALLLGGGLVFFGIGGDASGGLGDALGLSDSSSGGGDSQFEDDIDSARATLAENPDDAQALLTLAQSSYLSGQSQLEVDETGQPTVLTDGALASFEDSVDAWERYLDVKQGKPDASVATLVFRAYGALSGTSDDPVIVQQRLEGAVEAAQVVAANMPSPNSYLQLAATAYSSGRTELGDQASKDALAEVDEAGRAALQTQLKQVKRQGEQLQKQLKQASSASGEGNLDPLGGGDAGGLLPGGAPAP